MTRVTFVVKDDGGGLQNIETDTEVANKVPYLHTMLTTEVGDVSAQTHEICLPRGCTARAFASLLKRIDTYGHDLQFSWIADASASVALICVADFLMLADIIPELVSHCRCVVKSASDIKLLAVLKVVHPAVMKLVQDVRNGPLAGAITIQQAIGMLVDMENDNDCVCFSVQAVALGQWLLHPDRTNEDLAAFCGGFSHLLIWNFKTSPYHLKTDALQFISSLLHVAKVRPRFFTLVLPLIFRHHYSYSLHADSVKLLVGTVFRDVTKGAPLRAEEVKTLMDSAVKDHYFVGVRTHLNSLSDGCGKEVQEALYSWLGSCGADRLSNIVSVEFLQSIGAASRAIIAAQVLTRARNCDPTVIAFIKNALANGDL